LDNEVSKLKDTLIENACKEVDKAKDGDKKMIFDKPYTFKGGKWVQDEGGGKKDEDKPKEKKPEEEESKPTSGEENKENDTVSEFSEGDTFSKDKNGMWNNDNIEGDQAGVSSEDLNQMKEELSDLGYDMDSHDINDKEDVAGIIGMYNEYISGPSD